jgi:hypothetical protein
LDEKQKMANDFGFGNLKSEIDEILAIFDKNFTEFCLIFWA